MIRKYDGKGNIVEIESSRVDVGATVPVEVPILLDAPEQKYKGTWVPGKNHPSLAPLPSGPYAGITRYLPIPESQIER